MTRPAPMLPVLLSLLILVPLAAGCAAGGRSARAPGPASQLEVRIPAASPVELDVETRGPTEAGQALPQPEFRLTPAQEAQGRWLTLFEINVLPSAPAGLPASEAGPEGAEEPPEDASGP